MKKSFLHILLLSGLLAFSFGAQAKLFNGDEFVLDNGLRVIVLPNHKAPIVKHMVWYKSGGADELSGKGGSAHLLEHLMFRGTDNVSGEEFNRLTEENGMDGNAFTGQDMTAYHQSLDVTRLELAMFLEADRMQHLQISDKDFALERDIVFQERKQRVDNNPVAYFGEVLRRSLWQEHPYARPVTGMPEEIMSLTRDDVIDFYNKHYTPNNAILVLSGDIDVSTARDLAQKYYGGLKKHPQLNKKDFPELENPSRFRVDMSRPQINAYRVTRVFAAPSVNFMAEDIYALSVLSAYLGEGETSRFYKKLVVDDKVAVGVSTSYDFASRSYGTFNISAVPQQGVSPEELLKRLDDEWENSVNALNKAKLEKVKNKMLSGMVYLRDNPNEAANIVGALAVAGMSLADIEAQEDKIRAVTVEQVRSAARRLKEKSSQIEGILRPERQEVL